MSSTNRGLLVAAGIAVATAFGIAFAAAKAQEKQIKKLVPKPLPFTSEAARQADLQFHEDLVSLSRNASIPKRLRDNAAKGAKYFKKLWLDRGYAGRKVAPTFMRAIYGRYCGAGHGCADGWSCGEPIDEIDSACARHDRARSGITDWVPIVS